MVHLTSDRRPASFWFALPLLCSAAFALPLHGDGPARAAALDDLQEVRRPALRRFTIDPAHSEVGFDATSTLHDFTGRTHDVSGSVVLDPKHTSHLVAGRIVCQAASLDTDNDGRDETMREHLDVAQHPEIAFTLQRGAGSREGAHTNGFVGSFAIHGVQREYHIDAELEMQPGGGLRVRGRAPISLRDHGIVPPKVVVVEMADRLEVWYDLTLTPSVETEIEARGHEVVVMERTASAGGEMAERESKESLFVATSGLLWERPVEGVWLMAPVDGAPRVLGLATGTDLAPTSTADESFAEARATMTRLRAKLEGLDPAKRERAQKAVQDTLERLTLVLEEAPAEGELVRESLADGERWTLGGRVWFEFHGRAAEGRLGRLLAGFEGVPASVRRALETLEGVPATATLRTATMGGVRTLSIAIGETGPARIPSAAFAAPSEGSR